MRTSAPVWAILLLAAASAPAQSNIHPLHKLAWGENVGWSNWHDGADGTAGARVRDGFLSGFVWLENCGWLNVGSGSGPYANNPIDSSAFGVNIDASGNMYGLAWAENLGWVNFDTRSKGDLRARLDLRCRRFRGFAWSENAGWINLESGVTYVALETSAAVVRADCDGDGDVDQVDFAEFQRCYTGAGDGVLLGCDGWDHNGDNHVDSTDLDAFKRCFSGPGMLADPGCEGT